MARIHCGPHRSNPAAGVGSAGRSYARPSTTLDDYLGRRAITTADFAEALTDLTQLE